MEKLCLQTSSGHVERSFDKPQDTFFQKFRNLLGQNMQKTKLYFFEESLLGKKRLSGHVNFSSENVAENFLPEFWKKLAQFL